MFYFKRLVELLVCFSNFMNSRSTVFKRADCRKWYVYIVLTIGYCFVLHFFIA